MPKKSSLILFGILVAPLVALLVAGCRGADKQDADQAVPPLLVRLVHEPALADFLSERLASWQATRPTPIRSQSFKLELQSLAGPIAARQIAGGQLKIDGWLAAGTIMVNYANAMVRSLGAPVADCRPLFSSPLIAVARRRDQAGLAAEDRDLPWRNILATPETDDGDGELPLLRTLPFDQESAGVAALVHLAYAAADLKVEQPLTVETLASTAFRRRLERQFASAPLTAESSTDLLRQLARSQRDERELALIAESDFAYQRSQNPALKDLVALYPSEGTAVLDYQLCRSQADWVSPEQTLVLQAWAEYLAGSESQAAAAQFGLRPAVAAVAAPALLTEQNEVRPTLPRHRWQPPAGTVLVKTLALPEELRRPAATVYIIDTSGSMAEKTLAAVQVLLEGTLLPKRPGELAALISFSREAQLHKSFSGNEGAFHKELHSLRAGGGSALYDALQLGLQTAATVAAAQYRRNIVLITDSPDLNSRASEYQIIDLLRSPTHRRTRLFIAGILGEEESFPALEKLMSLALGEMYQEPFGRIDSMFSKIARQL